MNEQPPGWASARLEQIADVIQGQSPPGASYNDEGIGLPFFQGKAEFGAVRPMVKKWTTDPKKRASEGDVLLSIRAPVGPTNLAPLDCAIGRGLAAIRPLGEIDPRYVMWGLRATADALAEQATGTTFTAVSGKQVRAHRLAVAPLGEQQRIVAAIEEQFSRLEAAEVSLRRVIRTLQILRSSLITSLVERDWPRRPWKDIGRSQNGRAFPSRDYSDGVGVRLLRPGNLHVSGRLEWTAENTRYLPTRYEEQFPSYVVGPNELVMNLTAQSLKDEFLGRVCLTGPGEHCLLNQRLARLTPVDVDPRYLFFVFKSRPFRRFVDSLNKGSLIQHMFTSQIADFEVPVPPLEEQQRVVSELDQRLSVIDATLRQAERALHGRTALRRAILQHAFAGQLVPQNPSDDSASSLLERIAAGRASAPKAASRTRRKVSV